MEMHLRRRQQENINIIFLTATRVYSPDWPFGCYRMSALYYQFGSTTKGITVLSVSSLRLTIMRITESIKNLAAGLVQRDPMDSNIHFQNICLLVVQQPMQGMIGFALKSQTPPDVTTQPLKPLRLQMSPPFSVFT